VLDQLFSKEQCEKLKKECENIIESSSFAEEMKNIPTFSSQVTKLNLCPYYFAG
jgi:Asp-tRNA(Asn)/Glu-tRNA(Gln) amidotransferase C subunit